MKTVELNVMQENEKLVKHIESAYEVVFEGSYHVYESAWLLFRNEFVPEYNDTELLEVAESFLIGESDLEENVKDDENVFVVNGKYVYCDDWYDVAYDD